jgi:hypothetical protein
VGQVTPAPEIRDTILQYCLSEAERAQAAGAQALANLWHRLAEQRRETIALYATRTGQGDTEVRIV